MLRETTGDQNELGREAQHKRRAGGARSRSNTEGSDRQLMGHLCAGTHHADSLSTVAQGQNMQSLWPEHHGCLMNRRRVRAAWGVCPQQPFACPKASSLCTSVFFLHSCVRDNTPLGNADSQHSSGPRALVKEVSSQHFHSIEPGLFFLD
eukprot:m.129274 g.129274  ORF g.129274 m.129274 type:complete len:150 (+) comp14752_c0_seq6:610-1059(+)